MRPWLNSKLNGADYYRVELNGTPHYVHRLVAVAFCPGRSAEAVHVHHIGSHNGEAKHHNNFARNLVWCEPSANYQAKFGPGYWWWKQWNERYGDLENPDAVLADHDELVRQVLAAWAGTPRDEYEAAPF